MFYGAPVPHNTPVVQHNHFMAPAPAARDPFDTSAFTVSDYCRCQLSIERAAITVMNDIAVAPVCQLESGQ